jgi:hypothetical protein
MTSFLKKMLGTLALSLLVGGLQAQAADAPAAAPDGKVILRTATVADADPYQAGKKAAQALKLAMAGTEPKAVFLAECFEDKENKELVLKGVTEILGADKVVGGSVYGVYTQAGVVTEDAVALLGIGGDEVAVSVAFEEKMGAAGLTLEKDKEPLTAALQGAGSRLAKSLTAQANPGMMILFADAHSPKNQLLLDGVQSVLGKKLAVTGGSVNKNAGQNWICYKGKLYQDAAVAIMLGGNFAVAQTGRQAKDNDLVVSTAKEGSAAAIKQLGKAPFAILAFDCAGRKGKLKNVADELAAIQTVTGKDVPLFGCYCAGEFGPADAEEIADKTIPYGRGWHIMVSALGKSRN